VLSATESRSLDFSESADQVELRQRARQVAAEGVARYGAFNDSWIIGFSKEFTAQLAALGWIGLTWPSNMAAEAGQLSNA
jgi:alkylation response protein AidB-like acyl-CoA dehydrogenase